MKSKIALLMTGDEILSGDLQDSNSQFFCQELSKLGLRADQIFTCGDNKDLLLKIIRQAILEFDVLLINGGLGPTKDDYTYEALALAVEQPLVENKQAKDSLNDWLKKRGFKSNSTNLKQGYLPQTAQAIVNKLGSAPGAIIQAENCLVFCTPGIPSEMISMWHDTIKQYIAERFKVSEVLTLKLRSFGLGESVVQSIMDEHGLTESLTCQLGFRAHFPYVDCKLTATEKKYHSQTQNNFLQMKNWLTSYVIGENDPDLAAMIIDRLILKKQKLSIAESITGGMVASLITSCPNASSVLEYAVVSYSDKAKTKLLNVPQELIAKHGAVSRQTALKMLSGLVAMTQADYALASTGIAGPSGGTADYPLGTVFIACYKKSQGSYVRHLRLSGPRKRVQQLSAYAALDGVRRLILNLPWDSPYSFDLNNQI